MNMSFRDALLNNDVLSTRAIVLTLSANINDQFYKDMLTIIHNLFHASINSKNDIIDQLLPYITIIEEDDFVGMNVNFVENFIKNTRVISEIMKLEIIMKSYKYSDINSIEQSINKINKIYTIEKLNKIFNNPDIIDQISMNDTQFSNIIDGDYTIYYDPDIRQLCITICMDDGNSEPHSESYMDILFINLLKNDIVGSETYYDLKLFDTPIHKAHGYWLDL